MRALKDRTHHLETLISEQQALTYDHLKQTHNKDHSISKKREQQNKIQKALDEQVQANLQKRLMIQMGITPTELSLNKDRIIKLAASHGSMNPDFICIDPKTTRL